jgi:molybdenum cofactor guanylyltransferase
MLELPPLAGLVLSGGHSKRMHRDKATLVVDGQTQLARAMALLGEVCQNVFVSVRPDQTDDPTRSAYPQIVDQLQDIGPAAGILAAFAMRPDSAWLVAAVDLPLLDKATLSRLVIERDAGKMASAFISAHDGLPEPLCAIWEPASREPLSAFLSTGRSCPRKFLINHPTKLIPMGGSNTLANVNTPEEYAATIVAIGRGDSP